ncbi:MAG: hypothetical protein ACFE78_10250, partial [Candidatus Hodarchaeota archaeon]
TLQRFAFKSFGGVLSDGYVLFAKNWLKIIGPIAFFLIISIILKNLLLPDLIWNLNLLEPQVNSILNKFTTDPYSVTNAEFQVLLSYLSLIIGIFVLDSVIGAFFTVIAMCSVSNYLFKRYRGIDTNFTKELKLAFNSKLIIVALLIGVVVPLTFLLLIPGLILFGYFIFSVFTYHNNNGKNPLKEARFIKKGFFWKIIGVFIISSLIIWIITFIFQMFLNFIIPIDEITYSSWYNPNSRNYGMIILYDLFFNNLFDILLGPLFICFLTVLYTTSKAKKVTIAQYREQPVSVKYRYSEPVTSRLYSDKMETEKPRLDHKFNSGFYCPFCGKFMEKKLEKCPNCNETLDFNF